MSCPTNYPDPPAPTIKNNLAVRQLICPPKRVSVHDTTCEQSRVFDVLGVEGWRLMADRLTGRHGFTRLLRQFPRFCLRCRLPDVRFTGLHHRPGPPRLVLWMMINPEYTHTQDGPQSIKLSVRLTGWGEGDPCGDAPSPSRTKGLGRVPRGIFCCHGPEREAFRVSESQSAFFAQYV